MKIDLEILEHAPITQRCQAAYWQNPWPPEVIDQPPVPALQIKATTGLGKTRLTIAEVADDPILQSREIHYYAPDNALAAEAAHFARQSGLRAQVIHGRTSLEDSTGYCARYKVADAAAKAGLNVYKTCCKYSGKICPHFETCPYLQQWADPAPAFRVFNHQYVFLPKPKRDGHGLPQAALAIVDESVVTKCSADLSFGVDRLDGPFRDAVEDHLYGRRELSDGLVERGVDALWAWDCAEATEPSDTDEITPETSDKDALKALKDIDINEAIAKAAFFRAIACEIEFARPIYGITVVKDEPVRVNGKTEHQNRVHVHTKRECQILLSVPLLLLDADASQILNKKIFNRPIEHTEICAKQLAETTQVYSTSLSNYTLLASTKQSPSNLSRALKKVEAIVKHEAAAAHRVLVVLPKKIETALRAARKLEIATKDLFWHGAEVVHFGAIRGQDRWRSFNTIVIVGRNEPPGSEIDHILRSLFSDEPSPLKFARNSRFPLELRGYRLRESATAGIESSVHPHPKGQLILAQIRECETTQAIGRLRLVHADKPKRVVILCSVPVDFTIDELRSLDDLAQTSGRKGPIARIREAVERVGILPFGARDLPKAFPDLFPSIWAAKDALRELRRWLEPAATERPRSTPRSAAKRSGAHHTQMNPGESQPPSQTGCGEANTGTPPPAANAPGLKGGEHQIRFLFGITPHFRTAVFRRKGQRGKPSSVLIDMSRHADPRRALTDLLGEEIQKFEFIQPS